MKDAIFKLYKWFWDFILCRKDPFTYQLSRMLVRHGIFFWGVFLLLVVKLSSYLLNGLIWQRVASGIGLILMAWLIDHLIDHVRSHPDWYGE
jgi:hypothetical protein